MYGDRVPLDTPERGALCPLGHVLRGSPDVMPAHDLEQAGVIGQAQLLRRPGDVPAVPFQCRDEDAPLGFRLELLESAAAAGAASIGMRASDLGWHLLGADHLAVGRD